MRLTPKPDALSPSIVTTRYRFCPAFLARQACQNSVRIIARIRGINPIFQSIEVCSKSEGGPQRSLQPVHYLLDLKALFDRAPGFVPQTVVERSILKQT